MLSLDELTDVIVAFVTSGTAVEARQVLLRNPEILAPEIDGLFDRMIQAAEWEKQTSTVEGLHLIHQIIVKARRVGLDAATMELLAYDE
jgi:hypothetical protein